MFGIGEFARHGRVSVRMLRHYDAIGLLTPAHVDDATGYRSYEPHQLARLNRIVALKDLGFTLQQVQSILDERVSVDEMRGMLRLRRTELALQIDADTARLARVEARLRLIEAEGELPSEDVLVKPIAALRVAELTGAAVSFEPEAIAPVIEPLYGRLRARLARRGLRATGPDVAYYEDSPSGDGLIVHAGIQVDADPDAGGDFAIVDLPALPAAATIVHHGSMSRVMPTIQVLARWTEMHGFRPVGYNRELYLEIDPDPDRWVTELQVPIAPGEKGAPLP